MDGTITDRTRDEIKAVVESETPGAWQNSKQFDPYGCGGDPSRIDSDCDDDSDSDDDPKTDPEEDADRGDDE